MKQGMLEQMEESALTEQWVAGEYWPAKWDRLLAGLSAAELSIVISVALVKREEAQKGVVLK